jgi:ABC-2 type transport system ATP-binding protein
MQEIRAEGTTIFYVSHATASVRSMCDRVLVLESGRLMYDSKTTPDGSVDGAIRFLHYDDETDDEEHADEELGSEV